ncbi:MAG TPA: hypothetical protein VHO71_02865 [Caproiciproducens sp.]|nr:hypothetical protein [Caproiciproducens sp.]
MDRTTRFLLGTTMFLLGIIIGFLISPIKKGMCFGNHSGNTFLRHRDEPEEDGWDSENDSDDMPF